MLPREGTETNLKGHLPSSEHQLITYVTSRGDGNFLFCIGVWKYRSVNNPCYLERGRKQFSHFIYLSFYIVNNPCYLERGRKPEVAEILADTITLITHVTSRGDGNFSARAAVIVSFG